MAASYALVLVKQKQSKPVLHECQVCAAPAEYSHFGVRACSSCKIFFRRNGNCPQDQFKCPFDGHCEINLNTRHTCTLCRLAKCVQCGMSTDLFRGSRGKKSGTKTSVKTPIQRSIKQLSTSNLLQLDASLLTTSQWTFVSNLCNSYDESRLLSIGQRLVDTHRDVQSTDLIYQTLIDEFLACTYETTGEYLRSNNDLCELPSDERSIILHSAADNVSCMGCSLVMHQRHLFDLNDFSSAIERMYGQRSIDLHLTVAKFIDPDTVLVKLALSLFAFSQNTSSSSWNISLHLADPLHILQIQNKYAELTWKYLLHRYGYSHAVRRFVNLISWLEAITVYMFNAQGSTLHVHDVNTLAEQTELTLILNDADDIIETNKTSD